MYHISFLFNAPAPTAIYTLSLHDALPIYHYANAHDPQLARAFVAILRHHGIPVHVPPGQIASGMALSRSPAENSAIPDAIRSEEHTSELQSRFDLVCRLLLEKKKKTSK